MARVKSNGALAESAQSRCRYGTSWAFMLRDLSGMVVLAIAVLGVAVESSAASLRQPRAPEKKLSSASKATTSSAAKESAIRSIPLEKLDEKDREKISALLSGSHIFRRMPIYVGPCNPQLYLFLVRHPDVVVGIWEELGISKLRMKQVGPLKYQTQESNGTMGTSEFIYRDDGTHLIWVEGIFDNPLLTKPVRGTSLLILRTGYVREENGQNYITSRLDSFTHIDNVGVEFITRTLQPLMGKVVDENFMQTTAFVSSLSRTAEVNPRGVRRLAGKLHRVRPEVRKEFGRLAGEIAVKANDRNEQRLAAEPLVKTAKR
ncbi:MAG: hypothetical protein JXM70_20335 [Pirellulales bacterium]|nr:hypothetical protein [Pirellulales bacterium]